MSHFIHPSGLCESSTIGSGTRIWAFAHVLPGAKIGRDCNICDHVFIENDVVLGDRVTVKCGVQLWDGVEIADDVFIGPNVTFTNDLYPRSKQYPEVFARTKIHSGASIGANATLLPGIEIGAKAMVGAGAVVTRSVPPKAIVVGNPASIIGYTDTVEDTGSRPIGALTAEPIGVRPTNVHGVTVHVFPEVADIRGSLSVGEFERDIPFKPLRYFLVYDVPTNKTRGEHAHRKCHQFLVALKGSVQVVADDGKNREEFRLDKPTIGLYLPPMTWGVQYRYTADALLLVFASDYYDASDYIRDYEQFLTLSATGPKE